MYTQSLKKTETDKSITTFSQSLSLSTLGLKKNWNRQKHHHVQSKSVTMYTRSKKNWNRQKHHHVQSKSVTMYTRSKKKLKQTKASPCEIKVCHQFQKQSLNIIRYLQSTDVIFHTNREKMWMLQKCTTVLKNKNRGKWGMVGKGETKDEWTDQKGRRGDNRLEVKKWFLKNWTELTNTHPTSLPLHIPKQPHPELQEPKSKTDHRQEHLALLSPAGLSLCKLFLMANDLPTTHTQDVGL